MKMSWSLLALLKPIVFCQAIQIQHP